MAITTSASRLGTSGFSNAQPIELPHFNGIELCRVLRTHPYWCQLPILFLSVHNDIATQNQVFAMGADDFVSKPVMGKELANRILNRLTRARQIAFINQVC